MKKDQDVFGKIINNKIYLLNDNQSFDQIENSIFIEDAAKNLKPAKLLGLKTVWMENDRNLEDYKDNAEYIDYKYSDLKSFLNDISNSN